MTNRWPSYRDGGEGRAMLRWVHPEKRRYYRADLVPDLLGGWSVVTAWGGLGSHRGQERRDWVPSYEDGVKRLEEIGKRRWQRGYRTVAETGSPRNSEKIAR